MLSYIRVVCGTCERIVSDGWPADAPPEQCRLSRQLCRECEEEAALAAKEDAVLKQGSSTARA